LASFLTSFLTATNDVSAIGVGNNEVARQCSLQELVKKNEVRICL
jgi:hypothetical protein